MVVLHEVLFDTVLIICGAYYAIFRMASNRLLFDRLLNFCPVHRIKTGGENVASQEVEEVIAQMPGVAEVAVVGLPDPYWVEKVVAVVVPEKGAGITEEVINAYAREHLAGFKVPKSIFIVKELPKNSTGKVLKRVIRTQLAVNPKPGE